MAETRPTGEQLRLQSSRTGEHILDSYLEAAELGNRTLADLLADLYSNTTGSLKPDALQLRITASRELQTRLGQFLDPNAGWVSVANGQLFRDRGIYATGVAYAQTDITVYNGLTYLCVVSHTASTAVPSPTNFYRLSGEPGAPGAPGVGMVWQRVTTDFTAQDNIGYIADSGGVLIECTLPSPVPASFRFAVNADTCQVRIKSGTNLISEIGAGNDILMSIGQTVMLVAKTPGVLEVVAGAIPGPQGPPGPAGSTFTFTQPTPSSTWIINHNLGYRPVVELFTTGGEAFEADVTHTSINQTVVTINFALAGSARLI